MGKAGLALVPLSYKLLQSCFLLMSTYVSDIVYMPYGALNAYSIEETLGRMDSIWTICMEAEGTAGIVAYERGQSLAHRRIKGTKCLSA